MSKIRFPQMTPFAGHDSEEVVSTLPEAGAQVAHTEDMHEVQDVAKGFKITVNVTSSDGGAAASTTGRDGEEITEADRTTNDVKTDSGGSDSGSK